jgi:hypothetical protein
LAALGVLTDGEQLLELVDDQDEAWRRAGCGIGLRARSRSRVRTAAGGSSQRMADQHRRLTWRRRQ